MILFAGIASCDNKGDDNPGPGEDVTADLARADHVPGELPVSDFIEDPDNGDSSDEVLISDVQEILDVDVCHDYCGGDDWWPGDAEITEEIVPPTCAVVPGGDLGHPPREHLEYVDGGDFEAPAEWEFETTEGAGTVTPTEDEAASGTKSMHVEAQAGDVVRLVQRIYFVKGFAYTLSLQVKGGADHISATVMPYAANGDPSPSLAIMIDGGGAFPDWTTLTETLDVTKNAAYWQVEIQVDGPADLYIDEVSFGAEVYTKAPVPPVPAAPLQLNWLIHIEDPDVLVTSEAAFAAKALVFEELAKVLHAHGARLVIQPEITILQGAALFDPEWVGRLTSLYGVTWSTHTHGPKGPDVTMDDVIEYILERSELMESQGSGPVTDHNGNFDMPDLDTLSTVGFTTLSAYKMKTKQFPAEGYYLSPWRPSDVAPLEDEPAWAVHDPAGGLVFLPGTGSCVTRYKFQLYDLVERYLTAAISKVDPDRVNVYTFVDHVDHFYSLEGLPLAQYLKTEAFQADLAAYDQLLTDLIDPLVESGHVQWATTEEMRQVFEAWESQHCPRTPSL